MNEKKEASGAIDFAAAGVSLGGLWGFLASQPALAYPLSLPGGNWQETLAEWVLLSLGGLASPLGRVAVMVVIYAVLFGVAAAAAVTFISRIRGLRRWLDLPSIVASGLVGLACLLPMPAVWHHRLVPIDPIAIVTVSLVFGIWTALSAPPLAALLRAAGRRPFVGIGLSLGFIAVLLGWASNGSSLDETTYTGRSPSPKRLLLIGIDAASWENFEPGIESGNLANLASLRSRGASGPLQSTRPVLSPVVWTTIVTGVGSEQHGIRDFALKGVPYTSNSRTAYALWNLLPRYGLRSAFHYWWASWPVEVNDGLIVSDRFLETNLSQRVAPSEEQGRLDALADSARKRTASFESLVSGNLDPDFLSRHQQKIQLLDSILERDEVATELGKSALRADFDLVATYLRAPDAVGHKFWMWHFHDQYPLLARWLYGKPDGDQSILGPLCERVYQVVDGQVGSLIEAAGDDVNIMIVSDHGMASALPGGSHEKDEPETGGHHRSGLVLLMGPDIRAGATIRGATVYDVFPTVLYLLDLPVPSGLSGRVLAEALSEDLKRDRPLAYGPPLEPRESDDPTPIPTANDGAYLEKLRALGYIVD